MEKSKKHLPEMTPEERGAQIVELLAVAAVRLARKQKATGEEVAVSEPSVSEEVVKITASKPIPKEIVIDLSPFQKGRIPFGESRAGQGIRKINATELSWMKRILAWASEGHSLAKIVGRLNKEDHETRYAGKWNRAKVWWVLKRVKEQGTTE